MRKKKLIRNCLIATIICLIVSVLPLIFNFISSLDDAGFSYRQMDVVATVENDGSLSIHEEFYLDAKGSHTYIREIEFNKDNKTNYDRNNQGVFDDSSFVITVDKGNNDIIQRSYKTGSSRIGNDIIAFDGEKDELGDVISSSTYSRNFIIYLDDGINKNVKYTIDYRIENAINVFNDVSELNWKLVPTLDAKKYNVNLTLRLPDNNFTLGTSQEDGDIHYYGYGGSDSKFGECSNTEIKAYAKKLAADEEMEILCYFPSSMMNVTEGNNVFDYNGENIILERVNETINEDAIYAKKYNVIKYSMITISIIFIACICGMYVFIYKKYDKELESDFDGEYYRELPAEYPPAEMGYLFNEEMVSSNDLSATLMDLIRRKYISIDQNGCSLTDKNPNYKLVYDREKDTSSLTDYEGYLLYWYFDVMANGQNEITLNEIDQFVAKEANAKKYNDCNTTWSKKVVSVSKNDHFFDDEAKTKSSKFSFISIIGLLIAFYFIFEMMTYNMLFMFIFIFLITALSACFIIYTRQIRRKTQKGVNDYSRWKAFKKFLEDFSHFEDYPMPGVVVWEHYLVYATSFGIADLVEKQLRNKFKGLNESEFNNSILYYPSFNNYMSYRVGRTYSLGRQTIINAQAARIASSGGSRGGHGGFSGGSSHGGGGGHSSVR